MKFGPIRLVSEGNLAWPKRTHFKRFQQVQIVVAQRNLLASKIRAWELDQNKEGLTDLNFLLFLFLSETVAQRVLWIYDAKQDMQIIFAVNVHLIPRKEENIFLVERGGKEVTCFSALSMDMDMDMLLEFQKIYSK